jgi:CO/xanthine dehydrogenase FAD-binding subunit
MLLLDAVVTLRSNRGARRVEMKDLFKSYLSTVVEPEECLTQVEIPQIPAGAGWAFEEVSRRHGDFALVAAGAIISSSGNSNNKAKIVVTGLSDRPIRVTAGEAALTEASMKDTVFAELRKITADSIKQANDDIHAPAWYRRQVAGVLVERVCRAAAKRAQGVTL